MSDLVALAERVEAATGADRELDCLIWCAANNIAVEWQGNCLVAGEMGVIGWIDPGKHQRNFSSNRAAIGPGGVPAYTGSLDAAMQLIPEGWRPYMLDASIAGRFCWSLTGPKETIEDPESPGVRVKIDRRAYGKAATSARSLTAAALRARSPNPLPKDQ